jgi:hypothetical protein
MAPPRPGNDDLTSGLEGASRELRAAVIAHDHARADRAVSRFGEVVRDYWESLPERERAISSLPARTRELLAWAREMTLIQRNLAADQFAALQKARNYHGSASSQGFLQVKG